jgi:hypothetical protein
MDKRLVGPLPRSGPCGLHKRYLVPTENRTPAVQSWPVAIKTAIPVSRSNWTDFFKQLRPVNFPRAPVEFHMVLLIFVGHFRLWAVFTYSRLYISRLFLIFRKCFEIFYRNSMSLSKEFCSETPISSHTCHKLFLRFLFFFEFDMETSSENSSNNSSLSPQLLYPRSECWVSESNPSPPVPQPIE